MSSINVPASYQEIIIRGLSRISLFKGIHEDFLHQITAAGSVAQFKKNSIIFEDGSSGNEAYVIIHGKVKIYKNMANNQELILKIASPGEVFGEMALLDGLPRSAGAMTAEDSILFSIKRKNFIPLLLRAPSVAVKLLESISIKLRQTNDLLTAKDAGKTGAMEQEVNATEPNTQCGLIDHIKQEAADKTPPVNNTDDEYTFTAKKVCPLCRKETKYTTVRSKYVQLEKTDSDMCGYYRLVNPTFYHVIVCTHCGYAFSTDTKLKLDQEKIEMIKNKLSQSKLNRDFSGNRTIDQAINTYRLAIACQTMAGIKSSVIGYLFLRLGCLYRHKEMHKEEMNCLTRALEYFEHAFKNEDFKDIKEEFNIIYLIGELNNRMGDPVKAINWFGIIINHPSKLEYPYIVNKAKNRWQEIRLENRK